MIVYENPYVFYLLPIVSLVSILTMIFGRKFFLKKIYLFRHTMARFVSESFSRQKDYKWIFNVVSSLIIVSLITISLTLPYTLEKKYVEAEQTIKASLSIKRKIPVVVVLDSSGSMAGEKMYYARKTVREFILSTIDYVLIGFIAFNDRVVVAVPPTSNLQLLLAKVNIVKPAGGTVYSKPLKTAVNWLTPYVEFNLTPMIIFVTDGLPYSPDIPRYRSLVYKCAEYHITIYPIYISSGSEDSYEERIARKRLSEIANMTNGELYTVDRAEGLIEVFKELANKTIMRASNYILNTKIKFPYEIKHYVVQQYIFLALSALVLYSVVRALIYKITI